MLWLLLVMLPCYLIYRNDLKTIAKEDLAVPFGERLLLAFVFSLFGELICS